MENIEDKLNLVLDTINELVKEGYMVFDKTNPDNFIPTDKGKDTMAKDSNHALHWFLR
jgi:predicted transcriptional regulator